MRNHATAPQTSPGQMSDRGAAALRLLIDQLISRSRHGVSTRLDIIGDPGAWSWINAQIELCDRAIMGGQLYLATILAQVDDALAAPDLEPQRRATFREYVQRHEAWAPGWAEILPPDEVAAKVRLSQLWLAAWHLLAAELPPDRVVAALTPPPAPYQQSRPVASFGTSAPSSPIVMRLADAAHGVAQFATDRARAWAAERRASEEQYRAKQAAAREAGRVAAEARRREAEAQQATLAAPAGTHRIVTRTPRKLDGRALHGSVFGTWLTLVLLSWVSLTWGTLISIPFGVGLGLVATFMLGLVVVPLWGTFWGFVGMSSATSGTLRRMGFTPVEPDHPLTIETARMAQELGLRMPAFGVVDPYNAFAMGIDRDHATVVIGRPLLQSLSEEETLAVIGHELGHVVSGDMRRMMLMRTFQNATVWFGVAQGLKQFARWVICWAAELAILAFSRRREYWADAIGAALVSKEAMIGALRKLEQGPPLSKDENTHARFMIRGRPFSTHPSTQDRISALEAETYIRQLPLRRS